ncbi:hypothetical protein MTR67_036490, partial [Solanum verrucosum]
DDNGVGETDFALCKANAGSSYCFSSSRFKFTLVFVCCRTKIFLLVLLAVVCTSHVLGAEDDLYVNITILESATAQGGVCLNGSPPAYHLHRGHGTGLRSWIIHLDGGGWCNSISDCLNRSATFLGSTKMMYQQGFFAGILHNTSKHNPGNSNRNIRRRVGNNFELQQVQMLELSVLQMLVSSSMGQFFVMKTIYGTSDIQEMYRKIVNLHGSAKNLPSACTSAMEPSLCFFPQNVVPYVQTPLFIINSVYDYWQINNTVVPAYLDPQHVWKDCVKSINNCTYSQRIIIQAFGVKFLKTFKGLPSCSTRGYFLTSCYSHGGILSSKYWYSATSPRLLNKTIAEAIADWYFERTRFQYIDPYPCAKYCKSLNAE